MTIDNTSFFCYIYSSWLTKYLWKAYRKGITLSDIPDISPLDSCSYNTQKFENLWNEELRRRGPTSASLSLVAWRFVRFRFLTACILNACSQIIRFILQTELLKRLLIFSEIPGRYFLSDMQYVIYIVAFDIIQTILHTWSDIMNQRTALRLKAVCLSLLYKKIINLNNLSDNPKDEVIRMLSKDAHKIYDTIIFGTSLISAPVVTVCAIVYILVFLMPASLIGLFVFLLFYLAQYWLRHLINYCKESADEYTRNRMQKTTEAINCIRLIKINGWEQHFVQNILNIRSRESKWLWKLSYVKSLNSSLAHAIPIIAIILIFLMHVSDKYNLWASAAFPICVVMIVQMHEVFMSLKTSLHHLKDSTMTFNRIKSGLLMEDTSCYATKPYEASQAVTIVNGFFVHDVYSKQNYKDEDTENIDDNDVVDSEKQKLKTHAFEQKRTEILSNITFKAKKGQLIGICGRPKSGKSSLLLAALGQIKMVNGQLMRQGTCAYVAQKAWIANTSIRENILFDEDYEAKRYYEAQIVCSLRNDIKSLPYGDETEIGEGDAIPESMKQKIALARAFYADRDIYFLDDPLSCMDDKVSQEIFENFIVRALAEKTIIFVTNEFKFLDRCDYIYIMGDGKVIEHGRHKELMRLGKEYASMVKTAITTDDNYTDEFYKVQNNGLKNENEKLKEKKDSLDLKNDNISNDLKLQEANYTIINEDNVEIKKVKVMTYYTYAKSLGGFFLFLPIVLVYFIYSSIGVYTLLRLSWWIESIYADQKYSFPRTHPFHMYWLGLCLFLIILGCIVQSFVIQLATIKIADNLHNALLNKLLHASIKFFDGTSYKKIRNLFLHDLTNVSLSLPSNLDNTLRYITLGFFTFYVSISTIPWFTNYVVFASILFFFLGKIYRVAELNLRQLENKLKLPINSFLQNSIQGLSTIRTFKKENDLLIKFQDLVDQNSACCFVKGVSEKWFSIRLQVLTTTCIFVAASLIIIMEGEILVAKAGLTFVYLLQVPYIIQMGLKYFSKTEHYFLNVQNIFSYMQTLENKNDDKITTIIPDPAWPVTGLIKFDNVQLRDGDSAQLALNNVSFTINNAEKIGILTKNESDKNAFIAATCRLYELNGGVISIDGLDISKIDIRLLRNQLCIIPENPIFYGTIRFFLDPKKCHTDADIWSTLEKMHLKSKISGLASQLHYTIDKKIFNSGEKQLLFLARAFLSHNKILLLEENDEIDRQSLELINQIIQKEFCSSTILIIGPRLPKILACDRVLIMDSGKVETFNSSSNLLADQSLYLNIYK